MKTLSLRVKYQNESTLKIARFLEDYPAVEKVNYPGLASHPRHKRALELFDGCGGVLSFAVRGGVGPAERFMSNLTLAINAPSLGGIETLITRPAKTSHSGLSQEERELMGISDGLIRLSVGIESTEDLIDDLKNAFAV